MAEDEARRLKETGEAMQRLGRAMLRLADGKSPEEIARLIFHLDEIGKTNEMFDEHDGLERLADAAEQMGPAGASYARAAVENWGPAAAEAERELPSKF